MTSGPISGALLLLTLGMLLMLILPPIMEIAGKHPRQRKTEESLS
ncbi:MULTISPECIES: hypothetical protein [Rhizobium]|nr:MULTISPECIES: hypothetical protein [Rhizobium]